jgi:hypothetical protein
MRLTAPLAPDENCNITMQPIAESTPPLADTPELTCAELVPCGHRFAAMPLLTHFALNDMRCPMCRSGGTKPMNASRSFPGCAWAKELDTRRARADEDEDDDDDEDGGDGGDAAFAQFLQYQYVDDLLAHREGGHLPLMATIHFYAQYTPDSAIRAIQRAPLLPIARQRSADVLAGRPRFSLGAAAAQELVTTLHDMQAHAMDVAVGLWSPVRSRFQSIQRSPMFPIIADPGGLAVMLHGAHLRVLRAPESTFIYIPSRRGLRRLGIS